MQSIPPGIRRGINKEFKRCLTSQGVELSPGVDCVGVICAGFRSVGVRGQDKIEDLLSNLLGEIFCLKAGSKSFFDLYDERKGQFSNFLYARSRWRGLTFVKEQTRHLKERKEDSLQFVPDNYVPTDSFEVTEILSEFKSHLRGVDDQRKGLRLEQTFECLLTGISKQEIALKMGLRPPNISKRVIDLEYELVRFAQVSGNAELGRMLEALIGEKIDTGTVYKVEKVGFKNKQTFNNLNHPHLATTKEITMAQQTQTQGPTFNNRALTQRVTYEGQITFLIRKGKKNSRILAKDGKASLLVPTADLKAAPDSKPKK